MRMYHGGNTTTAHQGLCLTDDYDVAVGYAVDKNAATTVIEFEVDWDAITVGEADRFDDNGNGDWIAVGDDDSDIADTDLIGFDDQGMRCETHRTWRLMSAAAVAAVTMVAVHEIDEDE